MEILWRYYDYTTGLQTTGYYRPLLVTTVTTVTTGFMGKSHGLLMQAQTSQRQYQILWHSLMKLLLIKTPNLSPLLSVSLPEPFEVITGIDYKNVTDDEEAVFQHLLYLSWPAHGVPSNSVTTSRSHVMISQRSS